MLFGARMRGRMAIVLMVAAAAPAGAEPKAYCSGGELAEVSGLIDEIVTSDPAVPEIILDRSRGKCRVDAIRLEGALPGNCAEGRRVTGDGMVIVSRDGTWTWLETNEIRCE